MLREALDLVLPYIRSRLYNQISSVAFIVIYLTLFQLVVLRLPVENAISIGLGIGFVVLGLAFFMEGLVLGIMPLGESIGVKIPSKTSIIGIIIFSFVLGFGATLAEPAIGVLKLAGSSINRNSAPLLYFLLTVKSKELVISVGIGVGLAVIIGMLRFMYNWSLKPLIYMLMFSLLPMSVYAYFVQDLNSILGLAWDCGAVTTGPVTVPLVLALGLGVSRVVSGQADEGPGSGFGVVTLASLFPVLTVLLLSFFYYFSGEYKLVHSISLQASEILSISTNSFFSISSIRASAISALQAIVPLTIFMIVVYRLFLRERFVQFDEIVFGIILSLIGLSLFNIGIDSGLSRLGRQVGEVLPASYTKINFEAGKIHIPNFDLSKLQTVINEEGKAEKYFLLKDEHGPKFVPFEENSYNPEHGSYDHQSLLGPIFGTREFSLIGITVALIFAFFMGYGATIAEPALNALGATVEDITVGTFKKSLLMQSVAFGVGCGILIGVTKIIWGFPLIYLLCPAYLLVLALTFFASEEYVNVAWDSAGVTTGPVTVPLVLALGFGIGKQSGAVEGFGILAMASVFPILFVLLVGLRAKKMENKILTEDELALIDEESL